MALRVVVAVALVTAVGCSKPAPAPVVEPVKDSWYVLPPPEVPIGSELGGDRYATVVEPHLAEALTTLADKPVHQLTATEAARLAGLELPPDGVYVLLRALVLRESNGGYTVRVTAGTAHVQHNCLGAHDGPMTRRAVAVLPAMPSAVYVSCGYYL
ncbi:MAG TPA: hypothetical protein VD866_10320 [Urbifossiella sp.]|nr:hypothetical protein [Urbifossiella sp.]